MKRLMKEEHKNTLKKANYITFKGRTYKYQVKTLVVLH